MAGLGKRLGQVMAEDRQNNPSNWHPVLSSTVFSHLTSTTGGATMDLNTGDFLDVSDPSKDTYVVGKEPDTTGAPIPTTTVPSDNLLMARVPGMRKQLRKQTGNRPQAAIGSWKNDDGSIDIDASGLEPDLGKALKKADDRNEKAIFGTKKFRESGYTDGDIRNPNYRG